MGIATVLAGVLCFTNIGLVSLAQAKPPDKPPQAQPPAPPTTAAGPTDAQLKEARKHYGDGEKKYKAGDYAGALTEFQAADGIKATPQTARYMGLCHDGLSHFHEAVASYERFLADMPAKIASEKDDTKKKKLQDEFDEIQKRNDEIKKMPGKLHIESSPTGAAVAVDGVPSGKSTPADVELPPGPHKLRFAAEGREPTEKQVDVAFASVQSVTAELEATPPPPPPPVAVAPEPPQTPPPPPPPPPEPRSMLPAYLTGGVAIVAAGAGTVFGVLALGDKSDFNKNPTSSTADDGENHALIADMCFGVALTLGVTSAVLFLTPDDAAPAAPPSAPQKAGGGGAPKKRSTVTITPTPIVTPTGGGAGAIVRF